MARCRAKLASFAAVLSSARALDRTAANEANFVLHRAIAEAAHSDYLAQAYDRCMGDGLRLAYLCFSEHTGVDERLEQHLELTMADHAAMVAAIAASDAEGAERAAGGHVDLFRSRIGTAMMGTDLVRVVGLEGDAQDEG